ncbi:signal peptidase I [Phytohabitans sp. ZYX-F-186]|uniref:Signal peptidase I n=1 Tax=Phytohabitans maris TaxID=3071409 RepID=A0ABU0ZUA4_9ACTN|nr:signal peptidase I [Phytohabitans sp. ZYX-F-186]MDQ7909755.1 signal peptidase I [Phytohabitans sp. ZYX-F-186]
MIRTLGTLAVGALALGALAWLVRRRVFVVTVRGGSMEPTLSDGDRLVCRRAGIAAVHRGDIVVLERPDTDRHWTRPPVTRIGKGQELLVKRAVAVPGDQVPRSLVPALAGRPEDRVPPRCLVVLGDNGAHSLDSKRLGYIPAERVLGVVRRRLGTTTRRARHSTTIEA